MLLPTNPWHLNLPHGRFLIGVGVQLCPCNARDVVSVVGKKDVGVTSTRLLLPAGERSF